jgi:phospholipid/cholesterol/gamma-HCH transport system substrate-binding protein
MKISKQAQLGILIVSSLVILIWGISYLKGNDIFKQYVTYHVCYNRVDGLEKSNKVTLNGFQIGQISDIQFNSDHSGHLIVSFSADKSFKIPQGTVARIVSSDIMGTKSIELQFSTSDTFYQTNDTLPGSIESGLKDQVSMQVLPLKSKAEELIATIDSAMSALTVILNDDARNDLSSSFANINQSIKNIEAITSDLQDIVGDEKENIKQTLSNVSEITTSFKNNATEFEATLHNLHAFSDTLANMQISPILANLTTISGELSSLMEKLNSNDNSAGLLFNDDNLYISIKNLTDNLSYLTKDIQQNPKRYLQVSAFDFGKEVYINTKDEAAGKGIIFKVHLTTTSNKLTSEYFKHINTEEYFLNNSYSYFTGATTKYSEIEDTYNSVIKQFPQASIVAFKNGKSIKLEKALKRIK